MPMLKYYPEIRYQLHRKKRSHQYRYRSYRFGIMTNTAVHARLNNMNINIFDIIIFTKCSTH